MSKLYLMRHGQTLFNVLKRKQGWCDSPLTDLGIEQARGAGRWFAEHGVAFDHAYSSTSERAVDTLELVLAESGQDELAYERVKDLMRMAGLREARSFPDTQNIQRVVAAKA